MEHQEEAGVTEADCLGSSSASPIVSCVIWAGNHLLCVSVSDCDIVNIKENNDLRAVL